MQVVRTTAPKCKKMTIFQLIPSWAGPQPLYHVKVKDSKKWRLQHLPFYDRWYRFQLFWTGGDGNYDALIAGSDKNNQIRGALTEYIKMAVGGDAKLIEQVRVIQYNPSVQYNVCTHFILHTHIV